MYVEIRKYRAVFILCLLLMGIRRYVCMRACSHVCFVVYTEDALG